MGERDGKEINQVKISSYLRRRTSELDGERVILYERFSSGFFYQLVERAEHGTIWSDIV